MTEPCGRLPKEEGGAREKGARSIWRRRRSLVGSLHPGRTLLTRQRYAILDGNAVVGEPAGDAKQELSLRTPLQLLATNAMSTDETKLRRLERASLDGLAPACRRQHARCLHAKAQWQEDSAAAPLAHTIYLRAAALMMPSEEHLQRTTLAATPTQTCCKRKRDWASLAVCPPPLKAAPQPVARALACRTLAVHVDDGMDQSHEGAAALCALTLRAPPLDSSGAAEASQHGLIRPVALKR